MWTVVFTQMHFFKNSHLKSHFKLRTSSILPMNPQHQCYWRLIKVFQFVSFNDANNDFCVYPWLSPSDVVHWLVLETFYSSNETTHSYDTILLGSTYCCTYCGCCLSFYSSLSESTCNYYVDIRKCCDTRLALGLHKFIVAESAKLHRRVWIKKVSVHQFWAL